MACSCFFLKLGCPSHPNPILLCLLISCCPTRSRMNVQSSRVPSLILSAGNDSLSLLLCKINYFIIWFRCGVGHVKRSVFNTQQHVGYSGGSLVLYSSRVQKIILRFLYLNTKNLKLRVMVASLLHKNKK